MKLIDKTTGKEIRVGDKVLDRNGEEYILNGWTTCPRYLTKENVIIMTSLDGFSKIECKPSKIGAELVK